MASSSSIPPDGREWRRFQALALHEQGWKQCAIAAALAVSEAAVSQWLATARRSGTAALHARPRPGPPARLTAAQRDLIPEFLWHGAEAYGFRGDVWTCARVAHVIASEFGVAYSTSQVSRLLRVLDWSPQRPITRARQRDEAAITHWRAAVWPALRDQARHEQRTLVFVDEAGFYLLPGVVRTYSPRGQTPVLRKWLTRDHLAVMGGVTPAGQIYLLVRDEPLTSGHTIEFLQHLRRHAGERLLVIWDGSPIHRGAAVQEFLAGPAGGGIQVAYLPGYAPELNPWDAEGWHQLKQVELHNVVCQDLEELHRELALAIRRLRQNAHRIRGFFSAAGLAL